jgi:hypothetical protein
VPASPEQAARKERDREAAILLRRGGMSAAQVGEQLGRSARSIRDLTQGADLSPPPDAAPAVKRKAARKRGRLPRRAKGQPALGKMLRPIILEPARGGFGLAPQAVSASGLGPSIPLDGYGDPMGDGRNLRKVGENIIDLGTTAEADQRRYDARRDADQARNDDSFDDLEVPAGAVRAVLQHEDGSETVVDL